MAVLSGVAFAREPVVIIGRVAGAGVIGTHYVNLPRSGWVALVDAESSRLESTQLSLKRKRKLSVDLYDGMAIWASSYRSNYTLYFLRHARLTAGPVAKVQLPDSLTISSFTEVPSLILHFRGKAYNFEVERLESANPEIRRISIKADGGSSLLYDWRQHSGSTSENYEIVRWAGDLDRDGRMDLIIEFGSYFNGATCLFLSAPAKPPNLVKLVGCEFTSA